MENRVINIALVAEVAKALKELKDDMVFVGGATISLYTDDPAAGEIRPTSDIDMTIRLAYTFAKWTRMQERLSELGFYPDPEGHAICSYKYNNISVDIMPSEDGHMGPANKWYKVGFENLQNVTIKDESIHILSAPCLLATKFEAFNHRGKEYRTSHDFEDIIYVLDNRFDIVKDIKEDDKKIRSFLQEELRKVSEHPSSYEFLSCHIHPLVREDRFPILKEKIERIIKT